MPSEPAQIDWPAGDRANLNLPPSVRRQPYRQPPRRVLKSQSLNRDAGTRMRLNRNRKLVRLIGSDDGMPQPLEARSASDRSEAQQVLQSTNASSDLLLVPLTASLAFRFPLHLSAAGPHHVDVPSLALLGQLFQQFLQGLHLVECEQRAQSKSIDRGKLLLVNSLG